MRQRFLRVFRIRITRPLDLELYFAALVIDSPPPDGLRVVLSVTTPGDSDWRWRRLRLRLVDGALLKEG